MDRSGNRLGCVLPGDDFGMRSDQLRCCGNPSWTSVSRLQRRADRTATYKLRASRAQKEYLGISSCSEDDLETMKPSSLPRRVQIA
jgi:hypothetical protein